ncbi:MAG: dual specificity protein phosphatase family protein [Phycisphaeraceae bacterium]|nr:dual specificity protein phosphatase family protein [Phycisphaerales bacterium]MCB9861596.1 dual specificity protein phosphatase family protein [Phycisphaeraceae bacterium]
MPRRIQTSLCALWLGAFFIAPLTLTGCAQSHEANITKDNSAENIPDIDPPHLHRDGNLLFAAQPDETTIQTLPSEGVTTVINFRTQSEMDERVPFDEADIVTNAGMQYIHIPLGGGVDEEPGYDPEDVDRLAEVLDRAQGNVLLHCASGGRARTIWTAYLIKYKRLSERDAIFRAQRAGQPPSSLDRLLGRESVYEPIEDDK